MRKIAAVIGFVVSSAFSQTAETWVFRAVMSPASEVPAVTDLNASGSATIRAHVVRDAAGQVISGSVDFSVSYLFPGEDTFTGLHIHAGAAGVAGGVVIGTDLTANAPVVTTTGSGVIERQVQIAGDRPDPLNALRGLLTNPSAYYVNLHTTAKPGGAIRGQLYRAEEVVLMGLMSTRNEVPAITDLEASGVGVITALRAFDERGALASGLVTFEVNYNFPEATTMVGMHIHNGPAGAAAGVTIGTTMSASNPVVSQSGVGTLRYDVEVDVTRAVQVDTLHGLFSNPAGYYVNLHTTRYTGGAIRANLRNTDTLRFPAMMLPTNEFPPISGFEAQGIGFVEVRSLRNPDGSIAAAKVIFDINHRFPGRTEFTGMHIHDGLAGANGGVTINTGIGGAALVVSESGFGNITRGVVVSSAAGLATLNSMLANPERHYVNLHTAVYTGGAVRAQMGPPAGSAPEIRAILSAVSDPALRTAAPLGLVTLFGANFARVAGDLGGWSGERIPTALHGVQVSIGGANAPLLYVGPGQINAQVPAEVAAGPRPVVVTVGGVASTPFNLTVAPAAPAIFFDSEGGIVIKNSDFSLIRAGNPAQANDILLVYATGLGPTTPALATGQLASYPPQLDTGTVTATIGNQPATVIYSIASPGFAGLYQVAIRVPAGLATGNAPLVLRLGGVASNAVTIAVR